MKTELGEDFGNEQDKAYNKVKSSQKESGKAKNVLRSAGYARGGGVSPLRPKAKKMTKVEGSKSKGRADKYARGGSVPKGHHTKININVGNPAEKQMALKAGMQLGAKMAAAKMGGGAPRPMGGAPMQARPGMAPPPKPPMPGPGPVAPGGMPPGGPGGVPPTMSARGGRAYAKGGKVGPVRVKGVPHMDAGGGGAKGRLEKVKAYGTKGK